MILYTNHQGEWVGTQAEAKKWGKDAYRQVDVPTSKADLLAFLNDYEIAPYNNAQSAKQVTVEHPDPAPEINLSVTPVRSGNWSDNPNKYDIHDAAQNADMKHLSQAIAVWLNRFSDNYSGQ